MNNHLYTNLQESKKRGEKKFAVLIDPDKLRLNSIDDIVSKAVEAKVDFFYIGGSLIVNNMLDEVIAGIKAKSNIPTILFPGNSYQLSYKADGILFLSLISGRNAELLIGNHVISAPYLKVSGMEVISTGYMLIDGGISTTVQYISNTTPIPRNKYDIALSTALAGEMLGMKQIFLDAGSGAKHSVSAEMISAVSSAVEIPVIVGGGIRTGLQAKAAIDAGADVIVVGNAIETNPELIFEISEAIGK
jgi:putative glycerol-1-phosphate prenyltransferase